VKVPFDYELYNGKTVKVNVNSAVAAALAGFKREDENEERKERWRSEHERDCISYEALNEETGWEPTDTTVDIEADYIAQEEKEALLAGVSALTEKQQHIIRLYYYEYKTMPEIAREYGVSKMAISKQFAVIHKALKNIIAEI